MRTIHVLAPVLSVIVIASMLTLGFMESPKQAEASDPVTMEHLFKIAEQEQAIDIKLLERIEVIEKKLKIVPPKDSIRIGKREEK